MTTHPSRGSAQSNKSHKLNDGWNSVCQGPIHKACTVLLPITWPLSTRAEHDPRCWEFSDDSKRPARLWARCVCLAGRAGFSPEEILAWIIQQLVGKMILTVSVIDPTLQLCQHCSLEKANCGCGESFTYCMCCYSTVCACGLSIGVTWMRYSSSTCRQWYCMWMLRMLHLSKAYEPNTKAPNNERTQR